MKFHDYRTLYQIAREKGPERFGNILPLSESHFYETWARAAKRFFTAGEWRPGIRVSGDELETLQDDVADLKASLEGYWFGVGRPYYKVWPAMVGALTRLRLEVPAESLRLPFGTLVLRFTEDRYVEECGHRLRTMMVRHARIGAGRYLTTLADVENADGKVRLSSIRVQTDCKMSLREIFDRAAIYGVKDSDVPGDLFLRIALSVLMMKSDPEYVTPEVLAADLIEYERTDDEGLVEKARRRGVNGWNFGKRFESIPHLRRPHLAIRWTGKGRTLAKVVPIRGAVVHRQRMIEVPTGHYDEQGVEVEDA